MEGKITKSQKRHLKKVAKKKEKSLERKNKQLQEQINSGKLIEENHNGGEYSLEFTKKARDRFIKELFEYNGNSYLYYIRLMRKKYQTLLLKWSSELERDYCFNIFHNLLDIYYENGELSEELLKNYIDYEKGKAVV